MLRVEVADVTADWAVLGEPLRPRPCRRAAGLARPVAAAGRRHRGIRTGRASTRASSGAWRELLVPRADLAAAVGDRPLAGTWAAEALRVAAWRPRLGFETDHRTIPHEVDWLRTAVHLHKGCYRGQETVARVHNLGRPPRRLVFLHLDGSGHTLPAHGDPVELDGRTVGQPHLGRRGTTRTARSPSPWSSATSPSTRSSPWPG